MPASRDALCRWDWRLSRGVGRSLSGVLLGGDIDEERVTNKANALLPLCAFYLKFGPNRYLGQMTPYLLNKSVNGRLFLVLCLTDSTLMKNHIQRDI